jgi:outer membrane lipoprotein SlyB
MRCSVTAGKHINNTRAIARQLLGKRITAAMNTHATVEVLLDCNNGNGVLYVVRAEML